VDPCGGGLEGLVNREIPPGPPGKIVQIVDNPAPDGDNFAGLGNCRRWRFPASATSRDWVDFFVFSSAVH
jgi:hypothetical protein